MKVLCTSCDLFVWEGIPYPTSRCRYVDVSVGGCILCPSVSAPDVYRAKAIDRNEGCHLARMEERTNITLVCYFAIKTEGALFTMKPAGQRDLKTCPVPL